MSVKDAGYVKHDTDKKSKFGSFFKSKSNAGGLTPPVNTVQKDPPQDGYVSGERKEKKQNGKVYTESRGIQAAAIKAPSIESTTPPSASPLSAVPATTRGTFIRRLTIHSKPSSSAQEAPVQAPLTELPLTLLETAPNTQLAGSFPLLLTMPSGDKFVFTCTPELTAAKLAQMLSDQVAELASVPTTSIFLMEMSSNGIPMAPALPLNSAISHVPCISKHILAGTIPRVCVSCPSSSSTLVLKQPIVETLPENHQQEFAAKTFKVQLQLPGGQTLPLECKGSDTIEDVKTQIVPLSLIAHGIDLLSQMDKFTLTVPGVEAGNIPYDGSVSFIEACREKSVIPKLVLLEKPSAFTKKEKLTNKLIGSLIDKPLCWTVDELEKTTFHQKTTRLQYFRKKNRNGIYGVHVNPQAGNPQPGKGKMFFNINLPLNEVAKTIVAEENDTADSFIEKIFQKNYARKLPDKSPVEFALKVKGLAEYIYGEYPLYQYDHIHAHLKASKKIELVFVERQVVDNKADDGSVEEYSAQEFFEVDDATIQYSHDEIQSNVHSWDHLTCISIWELKREFRMRLISVENYAGRKKEDGTPNTSSHTQGQLYVTAGLYHGGELQAKSCSTQPVDACTNPRWHEWLTTGMTMYNIPRATRICFTLYERKEGAGADVAVAWVNCQLFDYKHELKTGVHELGMWPDSVSNPIGTCVGNSAAGAPILYVEFERYPLPIVFPTEPYSKAYSPAASATPRNQNSIDHVDKIIMKDPLYPLTTQDREILWAFRDYYKFNPKGLPKFLSSVPYNDMLAVQEMHKFLALWAPIVPRDALELLDSRFADVKVRQLAVAFLEELSDEEFSDCLLQLIQVLKYESYHDCALSRMLLNRALKNIRIGHPFFWYLKSEMHVSEISERYGLLLEAYLRGCGGHMPELQKQNEVVKNLVRVANLIKPNHLKETERREILLQELDRVKFPNKFQLPLNPRVEVSGLLLNKCKYMDSKKLPLWLVFSNADPHAPPVYVIFKSGDDLRQDMLTLQMIQLMDKLWKQAGLDLRMSPYGCISSGDGVGMIEVVLNADTTAHIQKEAGGTMAAFRSDPLANWIRTNNPTEEGFKVAVENFIRSCAGYCVATYVLGIGDRHNDNLMITKTGKLFHIDFGHFLGNYKKKFGVKRERAPFVFTPDFAYVMGGKETQEFSQFIDLCCTAYNIVRKHASVFINLFAMMLSTGIPELTCVDDISYLRDAFSLDLTDDKARDKFTALIFESLHTLTTQVNNAIHILAH